MVAATNYTYDANSRLVALTHSDSLSATLAGYTWAYDHAGRLTDFTVADYSGENATYTYDDTDQLVGVDRDGTANDESYTYDENGNRIGGGYTVGDNNQLLSDGTFNYTYDAEGNRLSKTEIATGYVTEYEWDYRNRLTAIIQKDDLGVVIHEVQYTYDIFNHRIVKTIDADGAGIGDPTQEIYIYDGLRQQRGNAGDHILLAFDEEGDLTHRYLHGPNVDQVLAAEEVTDPQLEGDVLWALTDHLGSVRDLAQYDHGTDTTTVVNHITYDAFGNITAETNAAVDFLFGFTGRERDTESDLQFNRARYYDPAIGRWISEDPIGFEAGDENLSRYVGNSPTNVTDPSGLASIGHKIKVRLGESILAGVFTLSIANRLTKLAVADHAIFDNEGEMKSAWNADMERYYKLLGKELYESNQLKSWWQEFTINRNSIYQWEFGERDTDTKWWLGGSHGIDADVTFDARCRNGKIEIKSIRAKWTWNDEIDARSVIEWWKRKQTWGEVWTGIPNLIVESIFWDLVMDKGLDVDYRVRVIWFDSVDSLNLVPSHLGGSSAPLGGQ